MLKLHIFAAVVAILVICFCDRVSSISNAEMDAISESCKAQEKASDSEVSMWRSDIEPKPRIVKCLDACVGEKLGLLANNRLIVDAVMNLVAMDSTDEKTISNMKEIVNECKMVTDKDRCESTAKILKCINDGTRRHGMKEIM